MDASIFGRSGNENATSSIDDRYNTTKPMLNLLSTSRNRIHAENERTNKPLDHPSAFSLQLSNLKLPKRLDRNNSISVPSDRACAPVPFTQSQPRLLSQVPPRVSAPYVPASTPTNSSLIPAASFLAPSNPQKTNNNSSDRRYLDSFFECRWRIYILAASSPFLTSQGSDDRAYTHSKRERSVSPNPQASFRQSSLNRPVTHRLSTRASPGNSAAATWDQHFDEALLVRIVLMKVFCDHLTNI